MYPTLILKQDKIASVAFHHPWVFSGALAKHEPIEHGSLVQVADPGGKILATGSYSNRGTIAVRAFEFGEASIGADWLIRRLRDAHHLRELLGYGPQTDTTGYRVVFGESDGIPGLVVDRYGETLVMQISTAGMDKLRNLVIDALLKVFKPDCLLERSDVASRQDEGLPERVEMIHGTDPGRVEFNEYGVRFMAEPLAGQKTGFFLDQKDLRREIQRLADGRRVLNLFSYTGSNGVSALKGGAASVHHVDSSEPALGLCRPHAELNGLDPSKVTTECADVFQYFNAPPAEKYDMIILDPPALIKSQKDSESGRKAYHFLNRAAMRLLAEGGILVTSSCSSFFAEDDMAFTLRRASVQSGMALNLLKIVKQSSDHPVSIYFPEAAYLKSFICKA